MNRPFKIDFDRPYFEQNGKLVTPWYSHAMLTRGKVLLVCEEPTFFDFQPPSGTKQYDLQHTKDRSSTNLDWYFLEPYAHHTLYNTYNPTNTQNIPLKLLGHNPFAIEMIQRCDLVYSVVPDEQGFYVVYCGKDRWQSRNFHAQFMSEFL